MVRPMPKLLLLMLLFASVACGGAQMSQESSVTAERDVALPDSAGAIGGAVSHAADGRTFPMAIIQAEQDGNVVSDDMSDYQGKYRLGPLPPGRYTVRARYAEARQVYENIVVRAGEQSPLAIELRFQAPSSETEGGDTPVVSYGSIEGIVRDDSDGTVFPGTVVSLVAAHLSDAPMAISDENGKFIFRGLRPGKYHLSCYYQLIGEGNVEIRQNNISVTAGQATEVTLNLDLQIRLQ